MTLPMTMVGGVPNADYQITNSLRLNGTSDYLSKTLTTSATTSGSVWVKRSKLGATSPIFDNKVYFTSGDALYAFGLTSTALYRDPSAWMHIFWNGTGVYVNGTLVTGTGTYTPSAVTNPRLGFDGTNYFSGYLSDFAFWNGSSASLRGGATDANGVWVARRPSAGYSFLAFGSSGALGTDTSGNGNNWTVNGSPVQIVDTPTNNFAALSPLDENFTGTVTLSSGNTQFSLYGSPANQQVCRGTIAIVVPTYFEVTVNTSGVGVAIGVSSLVRIVTQGAINAQSGASAASFWEITQNGRVYNNSAFVSQTSFTSGDVIGVAVNPTTGKLWFRKNATWMGTGDPAAGTNAVYSNLPAVCLPAFEIGANAETLTVNFGATAFAYTPPTGFKALCTANLPAVSIKRPSQHFNIALTAGASIKTSSEALYTYFFEWIKDRANSNNHQLIDTVRGTSAVLQSNSIGTETTYSAPAGSSVGWVWNAGTTAVSNTAGSITSSVSANTTAGFSVVTYTGTGAAATVGHGLGATPKLIVLKMRNAVNGNWVVWHSALGAASNTDYLTLESTVAKGGYGSLDFWNNTTPSSAVFSVGSRLEVNQSTKLFVAYCFAEIPGYSKFGSYTGNGNADGPFVYCGFRPRWLMVKRADSTSTWSIYDTARNPSNAANLELYANLPDSEFGTNYNFDILSNGFKCRTANYAASGGTYVFAAFAEYPFGGSNVAPCPAR